MQANITAVQLHLSMCHGGYKNTVLVPWSPTWDELKARLGAAAIGAKHGEYFVRAAGTKRGDKDVAQTGFAIIIDGDSRVDPDTGEIFQGAPDPQLVHDVLARLAIPHIIYSSHSNNKTEAEVIAENAAKRSSIEEKNVENAAKAAAAGKKFKPISVEGAMMNTGGVYGADFYKWRCVIPCEHAKADLGRLVAHLVGLLHAEGVMLNNVKENAVWSQPWYLPRVPDEARLGSFRFFATEPGFWVAPEAPVVVEPEKPAKPAKAAPEADVEHEPAGEPAPKATEVPGWESPIDAFNVKYTCEQILLEAGYEGNEKTGWVRPGSSSGQAGVKLLPDLTEQHGHQYVFSHGDDDLHDDKPHDAFDCYCILFCDGDRDKALAWDPELSKRNAEAKRRAAPRDYVAPDGTTIGVDDALGKVSEKVGQLVRGELGVGISDFAAKDMVFYMSVVADNDFQSWVKIQEDLKLHAKGKATLLTQIINTVKTLCADRKKNNRPVVCSTSPTESTFQFPVPVTPGCAIGFEGNKPVILSQSLVANMCLRNLNNVIAYDNRVGKWYFFTGTHWMMIDREHGPSPIFQAWLDEACGRLVGYSDAYKRGLISLVEGSGKLGTPAWRADLLPFQNCVLDLKTREMLPITADVAQNWCLPYDYTPGADCPKTKAWLLRISGNYPVLSHFLRCCLAAALLGLWRKAQKFLNLVGAPQSGKGSMSRLLKRLLGELNCTTTNIKLMETDKFEVVAFENMRMAVISDMEQWNGEVGTLLALTGEDSLPVRRMHKERTGDKAKLDFHGLMLILSNYHLTSSNKAGGLFRRRLTVKFEDSFTDESVKQWMADGGEEQLHEELPGLVNWLLELTEDEIMDAIKHNPPACVTAGNIEADLDTDTVAEWLVACCKPVAGASSPVGGKSKITLTTGNGGSGSGTRSYPVYEHADTHLYPNYLTWCSHRGNDLRHETTKTFTNHIEKAIQRWNVRVGVGDKKVTGGYTFVKNIALKTAMDDPEWDYFNVPEWLQ